jgi:hypothetical protein
LRTGQAVGLFRRELRPAGLAVPGPVVLVIVEDSPRPGAQTARGVCPAVAPAVVVRQGIEAALPVAEAAPGWRVWTGRATRAGTARAKKRC